MDEKVEERGEAPSLGESTRVRSVEVVGVWDPEPEGDDAPEEAKLVEED